MLKTRDGVRAENHGRKGKKRGCFFVRVGKMRARLREDERSHSVCVLLRRALCKHRARGDLGVPRVACCRGRNAGVAAENEMQSGEDNKKEKDRFVRIDPSWSSEAGD